MFKLNRQIESLENIEDNALEHDRELTAKEQHQYDKIETEIEELEEEIDNIDNALDYLREYEIYD